MIPYEVKCIAEELALHYKGSEADWEQFDRIAWKIYDRLQAEEKQLIQGF